MHEFIFSFYNESSIIVDFNITLLITFRINTSFYSHNNDLPLLVLYSTNSSVFPLSVFLISWYFYLNMLPQFMRFRFHHCCIYFWLINLMFIYNWEGSLGFWSKLMSSISILNGSWTCLKLSSRHCL
jgi:hypothetical protein